MYIIILIYPVDVNKHFPRRLFALKKKIVW